jgi:hypothetical protein
MQNTFSDWYCNYVANELGLLYMSSPKQIANGTAMFYDPQTNAYYGIYKSGYVRRICPNEWNYRGYAMYQLNRIKRTKLNTSGNYTCYRYERILANPTEQLAILHRAVENFRKQPK